MVEDIDVWTCKKCQEEEEMEQTNGVIEEQVVEFDGNGLDVTSEVVSDEVAVDVSADEVAIENSHPKVEEEEVKIPDVPGSTTVTKQEELFCLCRRPYDESQFYIGCESCQDWFHGRCVGVLPMEAESIEEYVCPNCMKDSKINRANLKLLDHIDLFGLQTLMNQIKAHKSAWPFLQPVDAKEVPDYYKVIKEPMGMLLMIFSVDPCSLIHPSSWLQIWKRWNKR